jgi:hypothetical protein
VATQDKAIRTSIILPEDAYARVQAQAKANDVSTAWVIRHAILKLLDEHEGQAELPLRLARGREARGAMRGRASSQKIARLQAGGKP